MRVLICGSRDWSKPGPINALVAGLAVVDNDLTIIEGGARGADSMAADAVLAASTQLDEEHGWRNPKVQSFPADWDTHGKAAGHIRNQQMLDEGKPDVVFAFVTKAVATSRGTWDMVKRASKAGIPIYVTEAW